MEGKMDVKTKKSRKFVTKVYAYKLDSNLNIKKNPNRFCPIFSIFFLLPSE